MNMRRWTIYKKSGEWDDAINGPDTGNDPWGTDVIAIDDLLGNVMCDRILDQLVVQAGDDPNYTSSKVPFAQWDMRAALKRALESK